MAETKTAKKGAMKPAKASKGKGFTDVEKAAMRARVKELQAGGGDDESAVVAKIASMSAPDRTLAERLHRLIKASAPQLSPKLWYGMPAYYKDGKLICHFQDARKFKTRYATIGFSDKANLDEGAMWPVAYALPKLTPAEEAKVVALIKRAVS